MNQSDELKHDGGKPRFELIDPWAEFALAAVLTAGAAEYEDDGWQGLNTERGRRRIIGATGRHLHMIKRGELYDHSFGGWPHAAHLMACGMFMTAWDMYSLEAMDELQPTIERWQMMLPKLGRAKNAGKA